MRVLPKTRDRKGRKARRPTMRGNHYWRQRKRHGRRLKYRSPDALADACEAYFDWVVNTPVLETRVIKHRDSVQHIQIPHHRPMTKTGMYRHLGINRQTWSNYKARKDYLAVCEGVENIIYDQLFTLAAADLINPRFIAPYLGMLKDESSYSGNGVTTMANELSDSELRNIAAG